MKTYAVYFEGIYPVGAVAVVTCEDEETAKKLVTIELEINHHFKDVEIIDIEELDISNNSVKVLLDGDY